MSTDTPQLFATVDDELLAQAQTTHDDPTAGVTIQRALQLYAALDNPHEVLADVDDVRTPEGVEPSLNG